MSDSKVKKFWTSEKLLSLTALLVSLLTLMVFIYQTNLIRQQQYMSVYPYLNLSNEYGGTLRYNYTLTNEGIGPAIIESVKVISPESKVYDDLIDYVEDVIPEEDSTLLFHANISAGRLIPANEKIKLIQLVDKKMLEDLGFEEIDTLPVNTFEDVNSLYKILNHDSLRIEIIYKSVYGEQWKLKNHQEVPEKL